MFDTRAGAEPDGEWNSFIELNSLEFENWFLAVEDLDEKGSALKATLPDGSRKILGKNADPEEIAELFGGMIRDVLIEFQRKGGFASLPLAAGYSLVVEEHDGRFGWTDRDDAGPDTEEAYVAKLEGNASAKSVSNKIAHWIDVLDRIARGKEPESAWSFLAPEHAIKRLQELGDRAVVPMLKFVQKWSDKPEWAGDPPSRRIVESPMHTPAIEVLMCVQKSGRRSREIELLLQEIMRRSIKTLHGSSGESFPCGRRAVCASSSTAIRNPRKTSDRTSSSIAISSPRSAANDREMGTTNCVTWHSLHVHTTRTSECNARLAKA